MEESSEKVNTIGINYDFNMLIITIDNKLK